MMNLRILRESKAVSRDALSYAGYIKMLQQLNTAMTGLRGFTVTRMERSLKISTIRPSLQYIWRQKIFLFN